MKWSCSRYILKVKLIDLLMVCMCSVGKREELRQSLNLVAPWEV